MFYFPNAFWAMSGTGNDASYINGIGGGSGDFTFNLRQGMLAYYTMDSGHGYTGDSIGGYHITSGGGFTPGHFVSSGFMGQALVFDALNRQMPIKNSTGWSLSGQDMSFAGWVKGYASNDATFSWLIKNTEYGINWGTNSGVGFFVTTAGPTFTLNWTGNGIPLNTWGFFTVTWNHTTNKMGVSMNGSPVQKSGIVGTPHTLGPNSISGFLGSQFDNASTFMDEWGVWNRELTDAEVAYLYNNGAGRTYPFPNN